MNYEPLHALQVIGVSITFYAPSFSPNSTTAKEEALVHAMKHDFCGNNYETNMQLDFALVALGFQKENTAAKGFEGSPLI